MAIYQLYLVGCDDGIAVMKENVLRRYLLEHLGVKYDMVQVTSNDYSSHSKKKYTCVGKTLTICFY